MELAGATAAAVVFRSRRSLGSRGTFPEKNDELEREFTTTKQLLLLSMVVAAASEGGNTVPLLRHFPFFNNNPWPS